MQARYLPIHFILDLNPCKLLRILLAAATPSPIRFRGLLNFQDLFWVFFRSYHVRVLNLSKACLPSSIQVFGKRRRRQTSFFSRTRKTQGTAFHSSVTAAILEQKSPDAKADRMGRSPRKYFLFMSIRPIIKIKSRFQTQKGAFAMLHRPAQVDFLMATYRQHLRPHVSYGHPRYVLF